MKLLVKTIQAYRTLAGRMTHDATGHFMHLSNSRSPADSKDTFFSTGALGISSRTPVDRSAA